VIRARSSAGVGKGSSGDINGVVSFYARGESGLWYACRDDS